MTIRIEREALLTVINTSQSSSINTTKLPTNSHSWNSCNPFIREEDEFVIVDSFPTKQFYSDLVPESTRDDDLASLCTLSTSSVSSCDSSAVERRVTFATQLVTDVWARERTLPQDVSHLYYSAVETQTFRQEYRLEKKLLSELSIDPEAFPANDESLSNLIAATASTKGSSNWRHRISRVCVVYKDRLETFSNPSDAKLNDSFKDTTQPSTSSFSSQLAQRQAQRKNKSTSGNGDVPLDFFDNDSFWSGSLTWY